MAINLSDLTGASTSANILAEVQSTADFLDSVPLLKNLADPSGATDAKQSVALNQPKALPLIKNPSGDLGGYLYIPDVSGNYATGPSVTIGANETWEAEVDMVIDQFGNYIQPMGGGVYFTGFGLLLYEDVSIRLFSKYWADKQSITGITLNKPFNLTYGYDGTDLYANIDGNRVYTTVAPSQSSSITHTLEIAHRALTHQGNYAIQKAKLTVNNAVVFDCDFNGSTSIRHGDTKFQASVGGVVTINQSGNDPATIIKKSVLRFSSATSGLKGLFANQIDGGYMFAAFSVLGTGVASGEVSGRVFSINKTGGVDYTNGGCIFSAQNGNQPYLRSVLGTNLYNHLGLYDDDNGDILHESKISQVAQLSKVNNADLNTNTRAGAIEGDEFNIGQNEDNARSNGENSAIDLEYLALFPATITDTQADAVRDYINNRNNVFDLKDGFGYYFFDPQSLADGVVTSWNGRIVGSDNGDADKLATQSTSADQPTSDGHKITFADNTDHLVIPSTTQAGWQVVGTSLGTFAYKVDADAITELNLLGNVGNPSFRRTGDLYGIILLPESATSSEVNEAKKLLTDRGASASVSVTADVRYAFSARHDIVQFDGGDMSGVTNVYASWDGCSSLTSFSTELPSATYVTRAWKNCSSFTSFNIELPSAINASEAWRGCSSLTSFSSDLSLATGVSSAWRDCSSLESFSTALPSATSANYAWYRCTSLTSFSSTLPSVTNLYQAWQGCTSLTDFSSDVFSNWNPSIISSGVFDTAWVNCPLTAQSVENILTSIDASGQYATTTGASGGTALADAGIDIDYNGDPLSAATTAAIDSLSGKGWQVYINGELVIPNILDLQPAAAYSLRSFDADADPNVVNVRRSSDGATSDFTASEVSDGTLRDWTLGDTLALDGQRMYFDGVDDYVDLNQSFIPATGDFSISFKYAHEEQTTSNRYILSQGNSGSTFFGLGINTNDDFYCFVGGTNTGSFGTTSISKGSVYEFKITRVGDVFTLYVDGVSVGTQTNVGLTISTNTNTYIGQATWTGSRFTKGTAYDIKKDGTIYYKGYGNTNADWTDQVGSNDATVYGSPALYSGQGFDGHVTTWYDQRQIVETGDAYGTTISGTVDGSTATYNQIAPAVAGEFYRVRFTASNVNPRGRIRFRNYASNADVTATAGLASMTYFNADGDYESYVPSDDGLGLWFLADAGQSFDYSGVSVQQVAEVPNNASQSTASAQPKIVDGGTLVTSGLDFDGVSSSMDINGLVIESTQYYMTAVIDLDFVPNSTPTTIFDCTDQQNAGASLAYGNNAPQLTPFMFDGDDTNVNVFSGGANLTTDKTLVGCQFKSGASESYINGGVNSTLSNTWTSAGTNTFTKSTIGYDQSIVGRNMNGKLAELLVFESDQSANRTGIEKNINDHFDIY